MEQNTRQNHKGGLPLIFGQQNIRVSVRDKDTHRVPGQLKIPEPAGLEGRDSNDLAMATDTADFNI